MEFMDGVTLVETVSTYGLFGLVVIVLYVLLCVFLVIRGGICIYHNLCIENLFDTRSMAVGMIIVALGVGGMVFGTMLFDWLFSGWLGTVDVFYESTGEYRVTVAETVDLNEFYVRYNVLEYKDGIYTVSINEIE